jgi:hypothetical protein
LEKRRRPVSQSPLQVVASELIELRHAQGGLWVARILFGFGAPFCFELIE